MKQTNRIKGELEVKYNRTYKPGKVMKTTPTGNIEFVDEEPISPALKVSDFSLRTQLQNGTFANVDMGTFAKPDKLDTANIEAAMVGVEQEIQYQKAKTANKTKEEQTTEKQDITYTTTN